MKLGFIGCGNMGSAMLNGAVEGGFVNREEVIFSEHSPERRDFVKKEYNVISGDNIEVAKKAKYIVLAIKPNIYEMIIDEIKDEIKEDTVIITITPAFTIEKIQDIFGKKVKVARAMPNTPAMVGCGMSGLSYSDELSDLERKEVLEFFESFGNAVEVKEELMGAVCAVSGSAPAFIYILMEAMADAAVMEGMSRKDAYIFAAKTVEGSAKMVLETGKHPGELKDAVCSPGGTTIAGVAELEENGFRGNIIKAMRKTYEKFVDMN